MKFLFKYATRSRPEWFKQTMILYQENLSGKHDCQFVVSCDRDDETMQTGDIRNFVAKWSNIEMCFGWNRSKIQAINADIAGREFDILFVVSDDMEPVVKGFDNAISHDMRREWPSLDGALRYNVGLYDEHDIATLSILGRRLYDHFGYVYWPGYQSVWCDNEFTDLVRSWSRFTFLDEVLVKHAWRPNAYSDELCVRDDKNWPYDEALYKLRKEAGFPGAPHPIEKT